jgi:acyl-CoA hydrolase
VTEEVGDANELDLTRYIRPGALVAWGQGCAEPLTLTEALAGQRQQLGGVRCFSGISTTAAVRPEHCDYLSFSSYTAAGANRALSEAGLLLGTSTLIKRAAVDKSIQLRDTRYTHDQAVLAAQHALVAVNSAIEVDLTGTASRIVARLSGPAGLSRADAGVIVTEYGVADLRGLSLARRRERMIAIAHPDHRAALESEAAD